MIILLSLYQREFCTHDCRNQSLLRYALANQTIGAIVEPPLTTHKKGEAILVNPKPDQYHHVQKLPSHCQLLES